MNGALWWFVDLLSRALAPDEREAVRGDLAESGTSAGQALRDLAGLAVRRQCALAAGWRPWLALSAVGAPAGLLLTLASRRAADGSAIFIWLYANNWDWTLLRDAAFLHNVPGVIAEIAVSYAVLACWAWTGGFLIGSLSRRAVWLSGTLYCLLLLAAGFLGAPKFLGSVLLLERARDFAPNRAVFLLPFYRLIFPLFVHGLLVLMPSILGLRQTARLAAVPARFRAVFWACCLVSAAALATQNWVWWQIRTWQLLPPQLPHLPSLLPLGVVGPAGYWIAVLASRRHGENV